MSFREGVAAAGLTAGGCFLTGAARLGNHDERDIQRSRLPRFH